MAVIEVLDKCDQSIMATLIHIARLMQRLNTSIFDIPLCAKRGHFISKGIITNEQSMEIRLNAQMACHPGTHTGQRWVLSALWHYRRLNAH
jgi:hypothetical protein